MRRTALWVSILSFLVTAACNALSLILPGLFVDPPGFMSAAYYTPYSNTNTQPSPLEVMHAIGTISAIALPIGLVCVSIYMLMTESLLRRTQDRGFEVSASDRQ